MASHSGTSASRDRSQVGLPDASDELLKEIIKKTPWFKEEVDVYRLAVAIALAKGLHPRKDEEDSGYTTKFSVQTFDPEGDVRVLVSSLAPEHSEEPYRWAMHLANKGVYYLHNELVLKERPIGEVLGIGQEESDA